MWPLESPFLKEEKIEWLFLLFFYIKYESPLLKERNLLRKERIGLGTQISLLPRKEKKQCLNLYCERPFGAHLIKFYLFLCLETWWPPSHSPLDYEG
jgi:hypothetical protein